MTLGDGNIFVAVGTFGWAKGATLKEAYDKCNTQVASGTKGTMIIREFPPDSDPRIDNVDGSIWYQGEVHSRVVAKFKKGRLVD